MALASLFLMVFLVIVLLGTVVKNRALAIKAGEAQQEAARLARSAARLEMVLKQLDPEKFTHVKARSDMEWQQAAKGLKDGELPVFFPLETAYTPITPRHDATAEVS